MVNGTLLRSGRPAVTVGIAHRQRNVALQCRSSGRSRTGQEAQNQGQHERQHHGVDGHAAANSQKPEETPVHEPK
jgi:hypothetical protein